MKGLDILNNLEEQRDQLSEMIINNTPVNKTQMEQLQTLMDQRDAITGAINQIIASKFNEAAAGLAEKVSALEKLTEKLKKLNKTMDNIDNAIKIGDQIIGLITSIVAIALIL